MKSKEWMFALVVSVALLFAPGIGQASSLNLDFGLIAPTAGTLSYAGGSAALIGTGIQVDNVLGTGTAANNGVTLTCSECALSFNTGDGSNTGTWAWAGTATNNFITITGTLLDSLSNIIASGTLLDGGFGTAQITGNAGSFNIAGGMFGDQKHPDLLDYYGFDPQTVFSGGLNLSFTIDPSVEFGAAFTSSDLHSGDLVNNPVPEPASVLLLGSGLAGLGLWGWKRRREDVQA